MGNPPCRREKAAMSSYHHIAIISGGASNESDISRQSGLAVANALKEAGRQITMIEADGELASHLLQTRPDAIFNALHGYLGENGCVQGLFETLDIPYTHSGVLASALAMDKDKSKKLFAEAGLPIAHHIIAHRNQVARAHILPPPYVIKPISEGSSLGVMIVEKGANHPPQNIIAPDWDYGDEVMVEAYIGGQELSCALLGGEPIGIAEIIPHNGRFYDYQQKYDSDGANHIIPANINQALTKMIHDISQRAYEILGCRGASRADFRYDKRTNQLAILEINTQPGMTNMSLVPEIANHRGMTMMELVCWMIDDASCNR